MVFCYRDERIHFRRFDDLKKSKLFQFDRIGVSREELGHVERAVLAESEVVRVEENVRGVFHFRLLSLVVVSRLAATDIGNHLERGIEHRNKAAAVPISGPVVGEVGNKIMSVMADNLPRIAAR